MTQTKQGSSLKRRARAAAQMTRQQQAQRAEGAQNDAAADAAERKRPSKRERPLTEQERRKSRAKATRARSKARDKRAKRSQKEARAATTRKRRRTVLWVLCGVMGFAIVSVVILYPAAQSYYTAFRDVQRSEARVAAVAERNAELEEANEELQTDEGIETRARSDYGYVMEGERAAIVTNVEETELESGVPEQVDIDSVTAPQTWYYDVLDAVFRYDRESSE